MLRGIQAIWGFVVPATAIALLALEGGSAIGSAVLPAPEALPASVVAVVSEVPVRRGRVTKPEFQHELLLQAVFAGRRSAPRPGEKGYEKDKVTAVRNLLERAWIVGQAAEWDIAVTHEQVSHRVAQVKNEAFEDGAEFRRFLKESHYTRRDVNERVEVEMLATRLQRRIAKGAHGKAEELRAFEEFIAEFEERWRGRTVCAPDYANDRCSNGPAA